MNAALLRVEAKDRLAVAAFRYVRSAQIPRSAVAIFDGRLTSTLAGRNAQIARTRVERVNSASSASAQVRAPSFGSIALDK